MTRRDPMMRDDPPKIEGLRVGGGARTLRILESPSFGVRRPRQGCALGSAGSASWTRYRSFERRQSEHRIKSILLIELVVGSRPSFRISNLA